MPTSLSTDYNLRPARGEELQLAVAIDDASARLFADAGVVIDIADDHPFAVAEHARWRRILDDGGLYFACSANEPVGFFALGRAGDVAYLEQLSVRPDHGRRGLGGWLLESACVLCQASSARELWLTTYAHLPWNKPFYERHGFCVQPEAKCNEMLRCLLAEQRGALPDPEQRIAMMRRFEPLAR